MPSISSLCGEFCAAGSMSQISIQQHFDAASHMDAGANSILDQAPKKPNCNDLTF